MFVGHYSASMAAKAAEPRVPLWTYFIASQLLDVGWGAFVILGIEKVRVDPNLPGSVFDLYDMPWTHSLVAAIVWSLAGALFFKTLLRLSSRGAVLVGLVVFSHWVLDLVVHRPDLLLWPGGPKVGFGLWNYPVLEEAIEMGLIAIAVAVWAASCVRGRKAEWRAAALILLMTAMQAFVIVSPPTGNHMVIGATVLASYAILTVGAWWAESATDRSH
jgi:membrane-bound metal-dependent hydrolase YbcI (DUF457 family)